MSDPLNVEGVVIKTLPALEFLVEYTDEHGDKQEVIAKIAGKMRIHRIRVVTGDKVAVTLAPDRLRGRLIRRL